MLCGYKFLLLLIPISSVLLTRKERKKTGIISLLQKCTFLKLIIEYNVPFYSYNLDALGKIRLVLLVEWTRGFFFGKRVDYPSSKVLFGKSHQS